MPQYPLRTVASAHPSQNRACATHAHGSSTTRFAEEVTIGSPEFAGEATGSVGAEQPDLLEIQTATLSTPAWPFEKYQFHLIGKVADTPAVTRYSVIRIMATQLVCGGSHDLGSRQSPVGSQPLLEHFQLGAQAPADRRAAQTSDRASCSGLRHRFRIG